MGVSNTASILFPGRFVDFLEKVWSVFAGAPGMALSLNVADVIVALVSIS